MVTTLHEQADKIHRPQTTAMRLKSVERALAHMDNNLEAPHSTETLAEVAALSPFHFNRVFREVTGVPPAQYLYARRIDAAKRLLLTTPASVTDICFGVGYNSLGSFTTRFTQLVGVSPSGLRDAAMRIDSEKFRRRCEEMRLAPQHAPPLEAIVGYAQASAGFEGVILVGLYQSGLPHAHPLQYRVVQGRGGDFGFATVADGTYYVMAAAVPSPKDGLDLIGDSVLRAARGLVVRHGRAVGPPLTLSVRAALPSDPPLLAALPLLMLRGE